MNYCDVTSKRKLRLVIQFGQHIHYFHAKKMNVVAVLQITQPRQSSPIDNTLTDHSDMAKGREATLSKIAMFNHLV